MADTIDVHVEGEDQIKILGAGSTKGAHRLMKNALRDIADTIESTAKKLAPIGKTEKLHEHPTDRDEHEGGFVTGVAAFGGGRLVRGATGFTAASMEAEGTAAATTIVITVAKEPRHARWVHEGTGIFGPHHSPIIPTDAPYLRFKAYGKRWKLRSVKGQTAQPYLTTAFRVVDHTYIPAKMEELRLQIAALVD